MNNWIEWFLNLEERHKKMISLLTYILRESGGLVWPILYGIILWRSWEFWDNLSCMIFIFVGSILTLIAIIYPRAWRVWAENRRKDIRKVIETYFNLKNYCKYNCINWKDNTSSEGMDIFDNPVIDFTNKFNPSK